MKSSLESIIAFFTIISLQLIAEYATATDPLFHMMPLGSHIGGTAIDEVTMDNIIRPKDFVQNYILPQKPLIIRGMGKDWSAYTLWTDEYLKDNYGKLELRLEGKKENHAATPQGDVCLGRDTMAHFINTYHEPNVKKYVLSELPTPLYKYVNIPSPIACGELRKRFVEVDLLFNSGAEGSILEKNAFNAIHCAVNGSQEWKLIQLKYNDLVYQVYEEINREGFSGYSSINPQKVDMNKFPRIGEIPIWLSATINAGDCLYIPSQTWRVANSKGVQNLAVSFLFQRFKDMNLADFKLEETCADAEPKVLSLEKVNPDWKYPGHGRMSMGNAEFPYYLDIMNSFFDARDGSLKYDYIYRMLLHLLQDFPYSEDHAQQRANTLFNELLELTEDEVCTKKVIRHLSRKKARYFISEYIQPPTLSNSCDHEYSYFSPDQVMDLFLDIAKKNGKVVEKQKLIDAYVNMGGHTKIAEAVWELFAGSSKKSKLKSNSYNRLSFVVERFFLFWKENYNTDMSDGSRSEEENMETNIPVVEVEVEDTVIIGKDKISERIPKVEL